MSSFKFTQYWLFVEVQPEDEANYAQYERHLLLDDTRNKTLCCIPIEYSESALEYPVSDKLKVFCTFCNDLAVHLIKMH